MSISKPSNQHWSLSVERAKECKAEGDSVFMLYNVCQNVWNRYMAQLARDAGFEPTKEMLRDEAKAKAQGKY